jgi:succinate dehydrogenase / fumarate reductase iron-sulfur subunit
MIVTMSTAAAHSETGLSLTIRVWRQLHASEAGRFEEYRLENISPDMSFLEMLDVLNDQLILAGQEPVAFDHDCREGICGACGMVINGQAHGPIPKSTTCQLHMRTFQSGDTIVIEPWRAKSFPVIRDLVVDRSAFDRIQQAGGFVSVNTGQAPEANTLLVGRDVQEVAMDAAACIGCGACVASCKNASAMLFVSAKVSQLALLPQGGPERSRRVTGMVETMDHEGFGNCSNTYECEAACPAGVSVSHIARMNREYMRASFVAREP